MTSTVGPVFADLGDDDWDVLHEAAALIASRTATSSNTATTRTEITA
ncbi:hypothetical protein P9139_10010 [Curtobacterium flaccumfaciens]|nr:hypothetical protein P9139_10010 [Curtobacterium flaccumfaciens]